jgi:hypothetical protein
MIVRCGMESKTMSQDEGKEPGLEKKPYAKPEVKQVLLRAEEAVLGACKTDGHPGPGSSNCRIPTACSTKGS